MSLSFPGDFPGKDRKDFIVGPVAGPDSVPGETVEATAKVSRRFRTRIGGAANYGSQPPTHTREDTPSPAQRAVQLQADVALYRQLQANRTPEERQTSLDIVTSRRAQDEFAKLPAEVQVRLLQDAGVDIERSVIAPTHDKGVET